MMKQKLALGLLASAFLAASTAFAATPSFDSITTLKANMMHPLMDITVINASSNTINLYLPNNNRPINIMTGAYQHIYSDDPYLITLPIKLTNVYNQSIYEYSVCREAIITVYNNVITTDNDLCN